MKVYRCDICGGIVNVTEIVPIKHWTTKSDVCVECWTKFKDLRRKNMQKAREE